MDTHNHEGTTATKHGDLPTSLIARKDEHNSTTTIIKTSFSADRKSSPEVIITESEILMDTDMPDAPPEDIDVKSDSEAETIVLPGKDGHSPLKTRRSIKHEDKSDDEDIRKVSESRKREILSLEAPSHDEDHSGKRKRLRLLGADSSESRKSHLSNRKTSNLQEKRHSSLPKFSAPGTILKKSPSPTPAALDKAKSVDRSFPRGERNLLDSNHDRVDREDRKSERRRNLVLNGMQSKETTPSLDNSTEIFPGVTKDRSESPHHGRPHKRSNSTQLPPKSTHSLGHRKRPTPLQYNEYKSDDSSTSGRSHPRSSRPRQRTVPTPGDSTMSPAALHTHRKRVDPSGATTLLALVRKDNFSAVVDELGKHPEDLNIGDNALNTPLHAASLEGYVQIVRMLLIKGCNVDIVNKVGDTPLHDAIENGHVEVVQLLLEHGANPRKAKKQGGDEPSDLAAAYEGDDKTREELQRLIAEAKTKSDASGHTPSGDQTTEEGADHDSYSKQSPRPSPTSEYPSGTSRMRARSNKTTDQDLYRDLSKVGMLREACKNGDHGNINKWLDINQNKKDAKSLLISAKAGDDFAVQLLLGVGNFDRDPEPLMTEDPRWSTPMLCAIHKGHIDVINCLLSRDFDPTRRWHNKTYYEIAQEREKGDPNYEVVVETLKHAFNKYSKATKSSPSKSRSPKLHRDVDRGRGLKRPSRTARDRSSSSLRKSPSKTVGTGNGLQMGHGTSSSLRQSSNAQNQAKRGPGRPRKEENNAIHPASDTESTPLGPPRRKLQASKVAEPDAAAISSENEPTKPRRKLVSGKELKGERDKQRRGSIASNVSTTSASDRRVAEESRNADGKHRSAGITRSTEPTDEDHMSKSSSIEVTPDKSERHDRIKSTNRDNSKERLVSARNDRTPIKRQRPSTTPPRSGTIVILASTDMDNVPPKRRKLEGLSQQVVLEEAESSTPEHSSHNPDTLSSQDVPVSKATKENSVKTLPKGPEHSDARQNKENMEGQASRITEHPNPVDLERKKQAKLARDVQKIEEAKQQAREAKEAQEAKEAKEAREAKKAQEAKEAKEIQEAKDLEAKEKEVIQAKEAKEAKEAQERLAMEEANAKREQEEEDRKVRQAQEERDKAEHQRRLYDEQKRIDREKLEQNRAAAQERERIEKARQAREKEAERLSKLPLLLREFDQLQQTETSRIASLSVFRTIKGYRYDTIRPKATGYPSAREQWMLNTDVALLLGEKDLELSRYTAWERIPLKLDIKESIWPLVIAKYSRGLPLNTRGGSTIVPEEVAKSLFFGLDLFFVKVSEFMYIVPNFPHLRGLEMAVEYQELVPLGAPPANKYLRDPDYDPCHPFWPAPERYLDGTLITCLKVETKTSTNPFPESKVLKRDFSQLILDEKDSNKPQRPLNSDLNYQESPPRHAPNDDDQSIGITPPHSDRSRSLIEGVGQESIPEVTTSTHVPELPNGTHSVPNGFPEHEMDTLV